MTSIDGNVKNPERQTRKRDPVISTESVAKMWSMKEQKGGDVL